MFNTTKQMKLEGVGPQINVRFNPNRLRAVRKWVSENHWSPEVFPWERKVSEAWNKRYQRAEYQLLFALDTAYMDGTFTSKTADFAFTMIHQMLVERNVWESDYPMRMPIITLLD